MKGRDPNRFNLKEFKTIDRKIRLDSASMQSEQGVRKGDQVSPGGSEAREPACQNAGDAGVIPDAEDPRASEPTKASAPGLPGLCSRPMVCARATA